EPEGLIARAGGLGHPVVEAGNVDAAQHHPRHAELLEDPPELLRGVDEMDDHQGTRADHEWPCSPSDNSSSTPPALLGWTNCTQQPPAPRVGSGRSTW